MQFYTKEAQDKTPPPCANFPCVVLMFDRWNDYGVRTQFDLYYYPYKGVGQHCGAVKILHFEGGSTKLPDTFELLPDTFCSLGQSISYYRSLDELGETQRATITTALNDLVFNHGKGDAFTGLDEFQSSLLRYSEALKLYKEGLEGFNFAVPTKAPEPFVYKCRVDGATADHEVRLAFADAPPLPGRIIAFIGTNGTGKTKYLRRLAEAIVKGPDKEHKPDEEFQPGRPLFSRVVAISYSAFDEYRKPPAEHATSSYYCGIYDDQGLVKSIDFIASDIRSNIEAIWKLGRIDQFRKALREAIPEDVVANMTTPSPIIGGIQFPELKGFGFSSGQLVLASILSMLARQIQPNSLILLDEPELHLHPNAIGGMMRALDMSLSEFRSYAIVTTHSPLVIQQLPGRYVRVFQRVDTTPVISDLGIESFGENLTTISEDVFHATEGTTLFGDWFKEMLKTRTPEVIAGLFDCKLSFNARTLLRSLANAMRPKAG